ncbi:MAG: sterol carrier family protein [Nocardioides sp.]|nr:sterol carrier family protein [Nocardioides sp.]
MPVRLRPQPATEVEAALARHAAGVTEPTDLRMLTKHFLAVLAERAPGGALEVRVPPYAAVQCLPGVRHTRGTPPAVVETDPETWVAVASGATTWAEAVDAGRVTASGERSDLGDHLPLR